MVALVHSPFITMQGPDRLFEQIQADSAKMAQVRDILEAILTPLYGSQDSAIEKIRLGVDRDCHLFFEDGSPVGVVVYKKVLSDEFSEFGIERSIEIKSLFLVDSTNNSGKGRGSVLLQKVVDEAKKLNLGHRSFHVTVSETKHESLNFFQRKGFKVVHKWKDKYLPGVTEYLLHLSLDEILVDGRAVIPSSFEKLKLSEKTEREWVKVIADAHWGDIHGLKALSDGTFISGSKDNSLCKWDKNGDLVKVVHEVEPAGPEVKEKDKQWITALNVVSDEYWVSGDRSGRVSLWTTEGDFVRNITPKLPKTGHISHIYNQRRVNCLASGLDRLHPTLLIGFPTIFDEYDWVAGRTTQSVTSHNNDWVYCLHPLSASKLLAATGATLQLWEKKNKQWTKGPDLLREERQRRGTQRPFISNIENVGNGTHQLGLTLFGGQVKVLDVVRQRVVNTWQEHERRVWSIQNLSANTFVTSAEDKKLLFWDLRERNSIKTVTHPERQMHTLLKLDSNTLAAGSDAIDVSEGAHIYYYDLRR